MKIRTGFVSNSSSSSFICDVCGRTESGFDAYAEDFEMCYCKNGHIFCFNEAVNTNSPASFYDSYYKENIEFQNFDDAVHNNKYGEIPSFYCPICQFKHVSNDDAVKYILVKHEYDSLDVVKNEILHIFKNYDELCAYNKKEK